MPTLQQLGEKIDHIFGFLTCTNSAKNITDENFKTRYETIESNFSYIIFNSPKKYHC